MKVELQTERGRFIAEREHITLEELMEQAQKLGFPSEKSRAIGPAFVEDAPDTKMVAPASLAVAEPVMAPPTDEQGMDDAEDEDVFTEPKRTHTPEEAVNAYVECPNCHTSDTRTAMPWYSQVQCNDCGTPIFVQPVNEDRTPDAHGITLEGKTRFYTFEEREAHKARRRKQEDRERYAPPNQFEEDILVRINRILDTGVEKDLTAFDMSELKEYIDRVGLKLARDSKASMITTIWKSRVEQ